MSHLSALSVVLQGASDECHDLITGSLAPNTFRRAVDAWASSGSDGQLRSSSLLLMHLDWPVTADDVAPTRRERGELLRSAANCIAANLRDSDVFGRADATTLGLLLPSTPTHTAEQIARRLRAAVSTRIRFHGQEVTLSVGLTQAISQQPWREAHEALRLAQEQGGDMTVLAEAIPRELKAAA